MNKIIAFCASLAILVGVSGGAGATVVPASFGPLDIDLRDASFNTVACKTTATCTVGGVTVTATGGAGTLFWSADLPIDGFGVRGGEEDEVNFPEVLTVGFSARPLTGVWFTNFFNETLGAEQAIVELFDGGGSILLITFFGNEPNFLNNGGAFGNFGAAFLANKVVFTSPDIANNDYSVAGLTVVPLPGALVLMVSGLAAFVVMARRRRKAAAA